MTYTYKKGAEGITGPTGYIPEPYKKKDRDVDTPKSWGEEWPRKHAITPPTVTLSSLLNDMFFLGFADQIARWNSLTSVSKPASFPPYNLIKESGDRYKIELAIAGYSKDDIDIIVERDLLTVSSKDLKEDDNVRGVIYQGIAQRQWRQKFILGEFMEVVGATLKDGLLTISVERNLPEEAKPKTIKIK